jgi:hypothetical protein
MGDMKMQDKSQWLVLALSALFACGGGGAGGANGTDGAVSGTSVALDDLVTQVTAAGCAAYVRCRLVSDLALCQAVYGPGIYGRSQFNDFGAAVATAKAGKATYDAAAARACLDGILQRDCAATTDPAACDRVFTGTLADGARCITDVACRPGSFCANPTDPNAPCDGVCTQAGTGCNKDSECPSGKVCDQSLGSSMSFGGCVAPIAPGAAGQPCGTNNQCTAGLFCSLDGICSTPAPAGQTCTGARNGFPCAGGLACVPSDSGTTLTCLPIAAEGEACTASAQCGGSLTSLACDPTAHVCVKLPASGPCLGTGFFACDMLTSFCDRTAATPTCKPFAGLGETCSTNNIGQCGTPLVSPGPNCVSSGATTGICTAPPGPAACAP